tara:strand:+ start:3833 stop:4120 length:288 start_codon:yes stop_codon:yes gene_type:complete
MIENNSKLKNYSICYEKGFYYIFINNKGSIKYVKCQTINGVKSLSLHSRLDAEYVIRKLEQYNIEKCNKTTIENWLNEKRREKYKGYYEQGIMVI